MAISDRASAPSPERSFDLAYSFDDYIPSPTRDNISAETGLLQQWPSGGPPLAWKTTGLGEGQSSVCIGGDRIFTMGQADGRVQLIGLSVKDGKILWKLPVGRALGSDQGGVGPRSTPATDGRLVWAFSPEGQIVCVQAATGRKVWASDMRKFGSQLLGNVREDAFVVFKDIAV